MSQFKIPATSPELRQRVYTCIDRLSDRATFSQASSELDFIARTLPSDSLSAFLSCILSLEASSSKPPARIHCLNLLSLLVDTQGSSLAPHLSKSIVPSLLRRLRDPDSAVRSACAAAVSALSPLGFSSLLGPLLSAAVAEQECNAQIGACLCLKAAVEGASVVSGFGESELRRVLPRLLKLVKLEGYKAKAALLGAIESIAAVNGGRVVNGRGELMENVVGCAVEMLSCDDWAARKAAAEVLQAVAEIESAKEVKGFVVSSLESRRFDKVKATRETMNRALEAWKSIPGGGPEEDLPLSTTSNPSFSKDNGNGGRVSPHLSRRSSYAGMETPKPKKTMNKMRSSLTYSPAASVSSNSTSMIGLETPQRKNPMSKSRSSFSDDSSLTDSSSSISKSSRDLSLDTPYLKRAISKSRSSLPNDSSAPVSKKGIPSVNSKRSSDWKVEIALPPAPPEKVVHEDDTPSESETVEVDFFKKTSEERVQKGGGWRSRSRVAPFVKEEEPPVPVVEVRATEEVGENNTDMLDLSMLRNQLLQIERQQSDLVDLLLKFMGNSQSGIDSLEMRVSDLERALDAISSKLGLQSGRIENECSAGSTCCPSTEFLSTKFWRKTEGRPSSSRTSNSGSVPNKYDSIEAVQMDEHRIYEQNREKGNKNAKEVNQNGPRGRTCSPRHS